MDTHSVSFSIVGWRKRSPSVILVPPDWRTRLTLYQMVISTLLHSMD